MMLLSVCSPVKEGLKYQGRDEGILDHVYVSLLVGVLVVGPLALLLAEFGHFSLGGVALLVVGCLVTALTRVWRRRLDAIDGLRSLRWNRRQIVATALLFVAAVLYLRPFENILVGRDAGVYINTGIHIARSGGILIRDDFFAGLPEATKQELLYRFPFNGPEQIPFRLPGFYWIEDQSLVVPQFLHLYPVWVAIFYGVGGLKGALLATPFFALLALGGLYSLGKQLFGRGGGLVALLFGLLNPAQLWFARYANSEIVFQALFLGGLYAWGRWQQGEGRFWGTLAGLAFGQLFLTRIDAAGVLVPLALFLGYRYLTGQLDRSFWAFLLPFAALLAWAAVHIALVAFPYARELNRLIVARLFTSQAVVLLALITLASGAVLVLGRRERGRQTWRWLLARQRVVRVLIVAGLVLVTFYLYFLRPLQPEVVWGSNGESYRTYNEGNFQRLGWYLTPLGLLLAVAGLASAITNGEGGAMALLVGNLLVYAAVYLPSARITPDHLFAARRYLTVVFPAGILLAVRAFNRLDLSPWWPRMSVPLRVVVGLVLVAGLMVPSARLAAHAEFSGAIAQVERLAAGFPERAVVLFESKSLLGTFVGPPLTYVYDREAFYPNGRDVGPDTLATLAQAAEREGRTLFFVSEQGRQIILPNRDLICEQAGTFTVKALERSVEHFPRALEEFTMPYRLCRVQRGNGRVVYTAASLPGMVGRVADDGVARYTAGGESPGVLAHGPYAHFPKGEWRVTFFLRGRSETDPAAVLDVVDGKAKDLLADRVVVGKELTESYRGYTLDFRNPTGQLLQFRVYSEGRHELWLERIVVEPRGD